MNTIEFDPFVLPFSLGALSMLVILFSKFFSWWDKLESADRILIRAGLHQGKTGRILKEVILESLLHRKMFKQNPLMGYMHMTFALGWLLLILLGNIESRVYSRSDFNLPYYPIFFQFFVHDKDSMPLSGFFSFIMDFTLLFVLSGVFLAWLKRFRKSVFGLKERTRHDPIDRIALTALWFIFPLRFLAESFTAGYAGNGGFYTGNAGLFFAAYLPVQTLAYPAWWAYSLSLCVFFVLLPYSRYMHIPAEVLMIYLKHLGFKPGKQFDQFSVVEVNACPSCGVCVKHCQLNTELKHPEIVPAAYLKKIKRKIPAVQAVEECLLCGRCQEVCPVGIHVNGIRLQTREMHYHSSNTDYSFIREPQPVEAEVVYFAGCMTHLTPGIKKAMATLLDESGVNWSCIDKEGGMCCGRPMQMSGQWDSAHQLIALNQQLLKSTGASVLVVSCPICLKVFKDEYQLPMEVLHHSQYLLQLVREKKINLNLSPSEVAFHDPCELGRGCGIVEEPRELIAEVSGLQITEHSKLDSLCCGGSLGSFSLSASERKHLTTSTLSVLLQHHPSTLITACPLCKKTFQPLSKVPVQDLAELLANNLVLKNPGDLQLKKTYSAK